MHHHIPYHFRLTLVELLAILTVCSIGAGALLAGAVVEAVFVAFVVIFSSAIAICSFVTSGRLQAASRGFVVPVAVYVLLVCISGMGGLGPNYELPSTRLLRFCYSQIHGRVPQQGYGYGLGGGYGYGTAGDRDEPYSTGAQPQRKKDYDGFLVAGHALICVMFGIVGSKFAGYVWEVHLKNQRQRPETPLSAAPPGRETLQSDD